MGWSWRSLWSCFGGGGLRGGRWGGLLGFGLRGDVIGGCGHCGEVRLVGVAVHRIERVFGWKDDILRKEGCGFESGVSLECEWEGGLEGRLR